MPDRQDIFGGTKWSQYTCTEAPPAFSCVAITSLAVTNGEIVRTVAKPSTTFYRSYGVTSPFDVTLNGSMARGIVMTAGEMCVAYDSGTPAVDEIWGMKPGQWTVSKNYPGFRCLGIVDSTNKIMLAVPEPILTLRAKADAAINANSSGTCSVYIGAAGSETDSTVNVTAYTKELPQLSTDELIEIRFVNGQAYIVTKAQGFLGKTDSSHAVDASGTVSLWYGTPGSESDTTFNVTAYNRFASLNSGAWCWVENNGNGWYLTAGRCS